MEEDEEILIVVEVEGLQQGRLAAEAVEARLQAKCEERLADAKRLDQQQCIDVERILVEQAAEAE